MAIISGLGSAPLMRLKHTHSLLSGLRSYEQYNIIQGLMSSERFVEFLTL